MKQEMKGIYLAVILSVAVIFVTQAIFPNKPKEIIAEKAIALPIKKIKEEKIAQKIEEALIDAEETISTDERIHFENSVSKGSIRLKGGRIDSLYLKKYKDTLENQEKMIELLSPGRTKSAHYIDSGWISTNADIKTPNSDSTWKIKNPKKETISANDKIILEWDNKQGIIFQKTIEIDDNYMFSISQSVKNNTSGDITLYPYGLIHKNQIEEENKSNVVHIGALAVTEKVLKEFKYDKLKTIKELEANNGAWAGFTERYWLTAFILNNNSNNTIKFSKTGENKYQSDFMGEALTIEKNQQKNSDFKVFSGAKEIKLLDKYEKALQIPRFDLAIDFGWYYFLTKPFFYILDFFFNIIGNMGWAILLFAALLRAAMFPIASKSYTNMSKMKKLQPKIKHLQTLYGEDKVKLQQETMALYKREKVNPASGCLPVVIQIPVFFSLYKVLNFAIEIRHAPFVGWIKDLSAPDPMIISRILHFPIPKFLDIGIWPIMMGITMHIQQKLSPAPTNKDQARMFMLMPIIFTFVLGKFASGLIIYWTLSNLLSIIQQRIIMRRHGV